MKEPTRLLIVTVAGCLFGALVLLPADELTSYYEYHFQASYSVWEFLARQVGKALVLQSPIKLLFYLALGGIMGLISYFLMSLFRRREALIVQLERELGKDLGTLIRRGEDDSLEFKSSFRYDYRLQKVNKALEAVIIKTLAGFMNTQGGSLLIGVADDGSIVGLEHDFQTLGRKDSDGYTQSLMSTVADKLGTPACRLLRILFHRAGRQASLPGHRLAVSRSRLCQRGQAIEVLHPYGFRHEGNGPAGSRQFYQDQMGRSLSKHRLLNKSRLLWSDVGKRNARRPLLDLSMRSTRRADVMQEEDREIANGLPNSVSAACFRDFLHRAVALGWIGWWFRRRQGTLDAELRDDFGFILAATLTLLGLIIGFSFSMATSRYDQRKNYEEAEANAIGTEYVRADLLPAADAARVRGLLRDYLDQRILFYKARDEQELQQINARTAQLQTELWTAVRAPAAAQPTLHCRPWPFRA